MENVEFDFSELRGKIKAVYGRQDLFAKDMCMSPTSLSCKMNGKTEFTHEEMAKAIKLLGLNDDSIHKYFLAEKFRNTKLKPRVRISYV